MKRMLAFFTVLVITFTLFGCRLQSEEEFETLDVPTQSSSTKQPSGEQPKEEALGEAEEPLLSEETPATESENPSTDGAGLVFVEPEDKKITFEFEDCEGLQLIPHENFSLYCMVDAVYPMERKTYETVMDSIGEDGLIVVGSAFGQREGQLIRTHIPTTKTQFKIEKVIYGTAPGDTVTVMEHYFPDFTDDNTQGEPCICLEMPYSFLKNNNRVLLFLKKDPAEENLYNQVYYCLPVPKNYTEYSEEGLNSLLDYYRGEESAYKKGYAKRWPQVTRSNDEVLEEQTDNVLVQLAVNQKILIWPDGHANFEGCSFPYQVRQGLREWSYPDGSPLKY